MTQTKNVSLVLFLLLCVSCAQELDLEGNYISQDGFSKLELHSSAKFVLTSEEGDGTTIYGVGQFLVIDETTLELDFGKYVEEDSSLITPLPLQPDPNEFQFRIIDMVDSADMSFTGLLKVIEGVSDEFLPSRDSEKVLIVPINQLTKVSKLEFSFLGYYPLIISLAELQEFGTNSFLVSMKPDNIEVISEESVAKYKIEMIGNEIRLVNNSSTLVKTVKD